jgi:hypothetical protein
MNEIHLWSVEKDSFASSHSYVLKKLKKNLRVVCSHSNCKFDIKIKEAKSSANGKKIYKLQEIEKLVHNR